MKTSLTPAQAAVRNLSRKKASNASLQSLQKKIAQLRSEATTLATQQPPTLESFYKLKQIETQLQSYRQSLALLGQGDQKTIKPTAPSATTQALREIKEKQQKEQAAARTKEAQEANLDAGEQTDYTASDPAASSADMQAAYDSKGKPTAA